MLGTEFSGVLGYDYFSAYRKYLATYRVPRRAEAQNLAERFHQHGREYLRFITMPGVEPTNNLAEQAIRFVVIDHRVTQGGRSLAGRE